jgi:tRNA A-37 threonylcarbamoyl transferase component Bud32
MYLCGVNEGMTTDENPNQLNAETISGCNDKLVDFLEDVRREDPVGEVGLYTSQMHVVHTVAGEFTNSTEIISLQVDGTLATQRRRLR